MRYEEAAQLALEIIKRSKQRLTSIVPALVASCMLMKPLADPNWEEPAGTDGIHFVYHPLWIISSFSENKDSVAQALLHAICHCLLNHHRESRQNENPFFIDGPADVKAELLAHSLAPQLFSRSTDDDQLWGCEIHFKRMDLATAGKFLRGEYQLAPEVEAWMAITPDSHKLWHTTDAPPSGNGAFAGQNWSSAKEKLLQGYGKLAGNEINSHFLDVSWGQPPYDKDYRTFLKELLTFPPKSSLDFDSIDPIWYHLGMELNHDIPIIEPMESEPNKEHGTLILAIDTSGSCEEHLCSRFLEEIDQLLPQLGPDLELHVMVCDNEIHHDQHFCSLREFSAQLKRLPLIGGGGTDFVPVFQAAETLAATEKVVGLLYFSDGMGHFPFTQPPFPTGFVLPEAPDSYMLSFIPSWVKLTNFHVSPHS